MKKIAGQALLGLVLISGTAPMGWTQKSSPSARKQAAPAQHPGAGQGTSESMQNPDAVQLVDPKEAGARRSSASKPTPEAGKQSATSPTTAATPRELLPQVFGGWQRTNTRAGKEPSEADPANAALMKEYGFLDYQQATYRREGRTMEVKAARFADAGGAYGAFTFYKQPEMLVETIGDQGAQSNEMVLFYRGNVFVQARLDRVTEMTAAELRELAGELPRAAGQAVNLPVLPTYLPKESYVKNSAKYVVGPVGFGLIGSSLPMELVSFERAAEVATGKYETGSGPAELMLISYPTPQIASERVRAIETYIAEVGKNEARSSAGRANSAPSVTRMVRRSGPLVVFVGGQISPAEAKSLLATVNYDANVTWNEPTLLGKRNNVANLVVAAMMLAGVILLFALAAGIAFGTIRILMKRYFPDRIFDRSVDVEIIRLDLSK
jgi:hypothetical protein